MKFSRTISAYIELTRPIGPLLIGLSVFMGQAVALGRIPEPSLVFTSILASMLMTASSFVFNDVVDYEIDVVNRPTAPLPSSRVSRIVRALKIEADNPAKAMELYSEAVAYLQQAPAEVKKFVDSRIGKLSKTTRCWVCRREIQGEDINYIYLPASINKYIIEKYGNDSPYLINDGAIAVCRVCYTMIYNLSDALAKNYYDQAMKALQEVEARLNARISALEAELMSLSIQAGRRYYMRD